MKCTVRNITEGLCVSERTERLQSSRTSAPRTATPPAGYQTHSRRVGHPLHKWVIMFNSNTNKSRLVSSEPHIGHSSTLYEGKINAIVLKVKNWWKCFFPLSSSRCDVVEEIWGLIALPDDVSDRNAYTRNDKLISTILVHYAFSCISPYVIFI